MSSPFPCSPVIKKKDRKKMNRQLPNVTWLQRQHCSKNIKGSRWQMVFKKCVLINLQGYSNTETPTPVFSCEICKIFKNIFFYRTSLVAPFEMKFSIEDFFSKYD